MAFVGRRRPYTTTGISRVPCVRCGRPGVHQWQVCANGRRYSVVCLACDIELNRVVLDYMRLKGRGKLMKQYIRELSRRSRAEE